jgi:predicted DNA-binding transcriptional regulator AlpA
VTLDPLAEAMATRIAELVAEKLRPTRPSKGPDRVLNIVEASQLLGLTVDELRRRAAKLPFTVKLGHRTRGFSLRGIQAWIERGGEP